MENQSVLKPDVTTPQVLPCISRLTHPFASFFGENRRQSHFTKTHGLEVAQQDCFSKMTRKREACITVWDLCNRSNIIHHWKKKKIVKFTVTYCNYSCRKSTVLYFPLLFACFLIVMFFTVLISLLYIQFIMSFTIKGSYSWSWTLVS